MTLIGYKLTKTPQTKYISYMCAFIIPNLIIFRINDRYILVIKLINIFYG